METLIAEKLITIYNSLGRATRIKDYYDSFLIKKNKFSNLNFKKVALAIESAFKNRKVIFDETEIIFKLNANKESHKFLEEWEGFKKYKNYVKAESFLTVINGIQKLIKTIYK